MGKILSLFPIFLENQENLFWSELLKTWGKTAKFSPFPQFSPQ